MKFKYPIDYSIVGFLVAIAQNTLNLATLFSSNEERNASMVGVSTTET